MSKTFSEETFAADLGRLLVPVQPTDVFRDRLRQGLQLASRQQRMRRGAQRRRAPAWTSWWIPAAFGVSLAAGSLIAYLMRSRVLHVRSAR